MKLIGKIKSFVWNLFHYNDKFTTPNGHIYSERQLKKQFKKFSAKYKNSNFGELSHPGLTQY